MKINDTQSRLILYTVAWVITLILGPLSSGYVVCCDNFVSGREALSILCWPLFLTITVRWFYFYSIPVLRELWNAIDDIVNAFGDRDD